MANIVRMMRFWNNIYQVLIDRESNNMVLVPYNFDAEQINSCQHLIAETKAQPYLFSV
jgi:hypothetical protein